MRAILPVAAAMAVLLAVQLCVLAGLRPVTGEGGYALNTSKRFSLNIREDDGVIGLHAALGYSRLHEDRFSYLFGVGGPVVHAAKPVLALLDRLGLITRFEDASLYQLYPGELDKAYRAYALYQLLAFTLWLPAAGYLLLSRHVSRRAGVLGAWCLALTPFLALFEQRIKPDTAALLFGLLSLHFALWHNRAGKGRDWLLAWALLGLSVSIKLTCAPFAAVLLWTGLARPAQGKGRRTGLVLRGAGAFVLVFLAANPYFLAGLGGIVRWLTGYVGAMHAPAPAAAVATVTPLAVAGRFVRVEAFFGPALCWVYPALLAWTGALWARGRFAVTAWSVLWLGCVLQAGYMLAVSGRTFLEITYYSYTSAALGLLLLAWALDGAWSALARRGCAGWWAGALLAVLALGSLARADLDALRPALATPARVLCHAWIAERIPTGAVVGVNLPGDGQPVNQFLRLDPFRWAVAPLGDNLERLDGDGPGWLVLAGRPGSAPRAVPGYRLAVAFGPDARLAPDVADLVMDEALSVHVREGASARASGAPALELALGDLARRDPGHGFAVLDYHATRFNPIALGLYRKEGETLLPSPLAPLAGSLRHAGSPAAFVHHVGPSALALWGVKYLAARIDGELRDNTLAADYALTPAEPPLGGGDVAAWRLGGFRGQALFAPDSPWREQLAARRLWRTRPLPSAGRLIEGHGGGVVEALLEVEADGPVDVVLSGGAVRRSFVLGPGGGTLRVPYEGGPAVDYEVNPVRQGGVVRLLRAAARPLALRGVEGAACAGPLWAFAEVDAPAPGRVFFAVPWHHRWRAEVDGRPAVALPGPAGVTCVAVEVGRRRVALRFAP